VEQVPVVVTCSHYDTSMHRQRSSHRPPSHPNSLKVNVGKSGGVNSGGSNDVVGNVLGDTGKLLSATPPSMNSTMSVSKQNSDVDAYYDPYSKCLHYKHRDSIDGGGGNTKGGASNNYGHTHSTAQLPSSFLEGAIVEINGVATEKFNIGELLEAGKLFHGEIIEIIDLEDEDEDEEPSREDEAEVGAEEESNEVNGLESSHEDDENHEDLTAENNAHGNGQRNRKEKHYYFMESQQRSSNRQPASPPSDNINNNTNTKSSHSKEASPTKSSPQPSPSSQEQESTTMSPITSRESISQKQREQQKSHILQSQKLFQRQQHQRQQLLHHLDQLGKQQLGAGGYTVEDIEKVRSKMLNEMELRHEKELMELTERQQKEQQALMDRILEFSMNNMNMNNSHSMTTMMMSNSMNNASGGVMNRDVENGKTLQKRETVIPKMERVNEVFPKHRDHNRRESRSSSSSTPSEPISVDMDAATRSEGSSPVSSQSRKSGEEDSVHDEEEFVLSGSIHTRSSHGSRTSSRSNESGSSSGSEFSHDDESLGTEDGSIDHASHETHEMSLEDENHRHNQHMNHHHNHEQHQNERHHNDQHHKRHKQGKSPPSPERSSSSRHSSQTRPQLLEPTSLSEREKSTSTNSAAVSPPISPPQPAAAAAVSPSNQDQTSVHQQKQAEIKAIMRDRSLGREERQRKLAEVRKKYTTDRGTASSQQNSTSYVRASSVGVSPLDEQRRSELQAVMKDRSLGREEKQRRMVEIKEKYALLAAENAKMTGDGNYNPDGIREEDGEGSRSSNSQTPIIDLPEQDNSFTKGGTVNTNAANAEDYNALNEIKLLQQQQLKRRKSTTRKRDGEEGDRRGSAGASATAASDIPIDLSKPPMHEVPEECETTLSKRKAIIAVMNNASLTWPEQNKQIVELLQKHYVPKIEEKEAPAPEGTPDEDTPKFDADRSIQRLIDRVANNDSSITSVDLDGKELTREYETALFVAIANNSHVVKLSLRKNKIGNEGAAELGRALVENESLTHVYLEENLITSNGAVELIGVLKNANDTVLCLDLAYNRVRSGLIQQLKKLLDSRQPGGEDPKTSTALVVAPAATLTEATPADLTPAPDVVKTNGAVSRWNQAAVKAATFQMVTKSTFDTPTIAETEESTLALAQDNSTVSGAVSPTTSLTLLSVNGEGADEASVKTKEIDMKDIETNKEPVPKLIKKIKENDPNLTILKLDGRKTIGESNWEALFEAMEDNTKLTHFSAVKCGLDDDMVVTLILALVENEDMVYLNLSCNKGLTDDTGKGFVKLLKQSNQTLKNLEFRKTKISNKLVEKINKILEERDEMRRQAKLQEERQRKIESLLSFSASDDVARRQSESVQGTDEPDDEYLSMSFKSLVSGASSKNTKQTQGSKAGSATRRKNIANKSITSGASSKGRRGGGNSANGSVASNRGLKNRRQGRGGRVNTAVARASKTARHMATLGGDIVSGVGEDAKQLQEMRKMRGECPDCGQKCFDKRIFKSTPLTIPNVVYEGRCLKCCPM